LLDEVLTRIQLRLEALPLLGVDALLERPLPAGEKPATSSRGSSEVIEATSRRGSFEPISIIAPPRPWAGRCSAASSSAGDGTTLSGHDEGCAVPTTSTVGERSAVPRHRARVAEAGRGSGTVHHRALDAEIAEADQVSDAVRAFLAS